MSTRDEKCRPGQVIEGIRCGVADCVYHAQEDCCRAGEIEVGPSHAQERAQTRCATFQHKNCGCK